MPRYSSRCDHVDTEVVLFAQPYAYADGSPRTMAELEVCKRCCTMWYLKDAGEAPLNDSEKLARVREVYEAWKRDGGDRDADLVDAIGEILEER